MTCDFYQVREAFPCLARLGFFLAQKQTPQHWLDARKLVEMRGRQFGQAIVGQRGELQQDAAMIALVLVAYDQACLGKAVHQFHRAVVANAQALGEIAHSHWSTARKSLDRQQRLVLACRESRLIRLDLAEFEEAADQVTELRQPLVVGLADGGTWLFRRNSLPSKHRLGSPRCSCR